MTYYENFEGLKKKIMKADESKFSKNFATQVNMTDSEGSGSFYIAHINNTFSVEPYDYYDHTSMVTASTKEFSDILAGKITPSEAMEQGNVKIEGNVDDILTLISAIRKRRTPSSSENSRKPML